MNQKCIISAIVFFGISVLTMANLNVALNKPATASHIWAPEGGVQGGEPFCAVDGDYETMWNAGDYAKWLTPRPWLIIDLETIYPIHQINLFCDNYTENPVVFPELHYYYENYNLYYSIDQSQWNLLCSGQLVNYADALDEIIMPPTQMRYIKFEGIQGIEDGLPDWFHLNEIEAFTVPEPCSVLLLGLGGLMLNRNRRFQR